MARAPVADLVDPANRLTVRHPSGYSGPAFRVAGVLVWGFTAHLLDRLLVLGGWAVEWDRNRVEELPAEVLRLIERERSAAAKSPTEVGEEFR